MRGRELTPRVVDPVPLALAHSPLIVLAGSGCLRTVSDPGADTDRRVIGLARAGRFDGVSSTDIDIASCSTMFNCLPFGPKEDTAFPPPPPPHSCARLVTDG